jgi:hypothetical protein
VVRRQQRQNVLEQMRPGHGQAGFLKQSLEILFSGLLAMKALSVMKGFRPPGDGGGELEITFGFADPLPRGSFHRGLYL